MSNIPIRPYAPADLKACAGIFDRAWREGHPFAPRKIDASVLADEIVGETIFVAEDDDHTITGFVSIYAPDSFIHHLYVEPRLRNRGIGSALLRHAVAKVGGPATLKCQLGNQPALGFYRHLGWTEIVAGTNQYGAWVTLRSPGKTSVAPPAGLR
jgi:GNAT superfamily N-acetyltransferase